MAEITMTYERTFSDGNYGSEGPVVELDGCVRRRTGERHGQAKLTLAEVAEIRRKYVPFKVTQRMLSAEYGVSVSQIQNITQGCQWKA